MTQKSSNLTFSSHLIFSEPGKKTIIRMAGGVKKYETHREPTSGEVLFAAGPFLDISHIFP
jgi:hypothetical protein